MQIGVRELRQQASKFLAMVQAGEVIDVASRGRVVARLVPVEGDEWEQMIIAGEVQLPEHDDVLSIEPLELDIDVSARLRAGRDDRQ
jgi:prevent-host-death family protein